MARDLTGKAAAATGRDSDPEPDPEPDPDSEPEPGARPNRATRPSDRPQKHAPLRLNPSGKSRARTTGCKDVVGPQRRSVA